MKFIPLHTKNTTIVYKNSICSSASIVVAIFIMLSVLIPVLLVSLLSPYSGITESRVLYEQPRLAFQFQSIFMAETVERKMAAEELVVCSTFAAFNERMGPLARKCAGSQYWSEDFNHDGLVDRVHFQLELDNLELPLKSFDLMLFFETKLKHKCVLSPPAVLTHRLLIPDTEQQLKTGTINLKAELLLKQYTEFICPFLGRNTKTHFREIKLAANDSSVVNVREYQLESLLREVKVNPAYFELQVQETYYRHDYLAASLRLLLDIEVVPVPARYHLSVWERLGQFWLYFASFFGISFYIMNKLKDFLFSRHIIRSWEIIPWKKLY